MSQAAHLQKLEQKHGELDRAIARAHAHHSLSDDEIQRMKKQKLRLKEQIERTRHNAA